MKKKSDPIKELFKTLANDQDITGFEIKNTEENYSSVLNTRRVLK